MRSERRRFCTALGASLLLAALPVRADDTVMDAEIDYLLAKVAASDCVFIRNGKEHDPEAARDHLQMKRERGRRYYDSTEQFIERIASRSSMSGKDYHIRCGGAEQTAQSWFTAALAEYRSRAAGSSR